MVEHIAHGAFEIDLAPADALVEGTGRFDFTKRWSGDLLADGVGVMLSGGNPQSGSAGYVAIETITGSLNGREGSFAFVQRGLMSASGVVLDYSVVPGSGSGELSGITGALDVDAANGHAWVLTYDLPETGGQ
jgi:hypothetical protein